MKHKFSLTQPIGNKTNDGTKTFFLFLVYKKSNLLQRNTSFNTKYIEESIKHSVFKYNYRKAISLVRKEL